MKDELIKAILPIIEQTKEGIARGIEVLMEQSPILVKEILTFHAWKYGLLTCLGVLCFLSLLMIIPCLKAIKKKDAWEAAPFLLFFMLPGGLGLGIFFENVFAYIKVLAAPRLFLVEYIGKLIQ